MKIKLDGIECRPRKYGCDVEYMAGSGLLQARTLWRQFQGSDAKHQSQSFGAALPDGPLFSVCQDPNNVPTYQVED